MPRKTKQAAAKAAPKRTRPTAVTPAPSVPILSADDVRAILHDLTETVAPGDVEDLLELEDRLRARAAAMDPHLESLRIQVDFTLDFLRDHIEGECQQVPYSTVSLLTAGICYFADEMDVIPDFLPGVGRLDDAAVMQMAFEMAADGIRRYCTAKGRSAEPLFGTRPAVPPRTPKTSGRKRP